MLLLRRGDFAEDEAAQDRDLLIVRVYMPILRWALGHKFITILIAVLLTGGSLSLLTTIPITFFPSDAPEYLLIDVELPTESSAGDTFEAVVQVEAVLAGFQARNTGNAVNAMVQPITSEAHSSVPFVKDYQATLFAASDDFGGQSETGGANIAGIIVTLEEDVPPDVEDLVRDAIPTLADAEITVTALEQGPPTDALEVTVTGSNYSDISAYAKRLEAEISGMDGIINLTSDISEARDEVVIRIDPRRAAQYGITASSGAQQVNRYIVGQTVTEVELEGSTMDIILRGDPDGVDNIEKLKSLRIEGMTGAVPLGAISDISIERGPVSISRFDGERSASITADITTEDTQAVGADLQRRIDSLEAPPGVEVRTGGIFTQIAEGFQDVFTAMAIGIALVYLVMVASLGSLRNPFIIVMSLPLALVGAMAALAITGRTLSLSAVDGNPAADRGGGHQRHRPDSVRRAVAGTGVGSLRGTHRGKQGPDEANPDDGIHYHFRAAAPGDLCRRDGGDHRRGVGHRSHRRPDQFHLPHAGRGASGLYHSASEHPVPAPRHPAYPAVDQFRRGCHRKHRSIKTPDPGLCGAALQL